MYYLGAPTVLSLATNIQATCKESKDIELSGQDLYKYHQFDLDRKNVT